MASRCLTAGAVPRVVRPRLSPPGAATAPSCRKPRRRLPGWPGCTSERHRPHPSPRPDRCAPPRRPSSPRRRRGSWPGAASVADAVRGTAHASWREGRGRRRTPVEPRRRQAARARPPKVARRARAGRKHLASRATGLGSRRLLRRDRRATTRTAPVGRAIPPEDLPAWATAAGQKPRPRLPHRSCRAPRRHGRRGLQRGSRLFH